MFADWPAGRRIAFSALVSFCVAIIVVTPVNFIGNKLWSFRHRGGS